MAFEVPARYPASAPNGKPAAASSIGARRTQINRRMPGRRSNPALTAPSARRNGRRSPTSRASSASREKPLKPMRKNTTATTAMISANAQRNSARPSRMSAASTWRTTDIGRMMNEAMTFAARIVLALRLMITAPATMAATWQIVDRARARRMPTGK